MGRRIRQSIPERREGLGQEQSFEIYYGIDLSATLQAELGTASPLLLGCCLSNRCISIPVFEKRNSRKQRLGDRGGSAFTLLTELKVSVKKGADSRKLFNNAPKLGRDRLDEHKLHSNVSNRTVGVMDDLTEGDGSPGQSFHKFHCFGPR